MISLFSKNARNTPPQKSAGLGFLFRLPGLRFFRFCTSLLCLGTLLSGTSSHAQSTVSSMAPQFWNDPAFVKDFLGSYAFLAGYEPSLSDEEREVLRSLIDSIKTNPALANQQLEAQIKTSSSAAFDFILANLYFQEGNLAKATQFYRNAIEKHPSFRRAYKNLGLLYVQNNNFDEAIPTISKALELGDVDGRTYGLLGYGYLLQERYYPAEVAYRQAILMQPDVKDWKLGLARTLLQTERYPDAIALLDTLLKEEPDNPDFWLLQSNAYLGKGEPMAAAKNLELVRRMGAADLRTLTLLGDIYMNNQAPDLALEAYLAAVDRASPSDIAPLLRAADLLTRTGNYAQAATIIERSRARLGAPISQSDQLKLLNLDAKIARAQGDDATAVSALKEIVERDALNGEAIIELANHYADQGLLPEAINRYEQAQKIRDYERPALIAHAQARVRAGHYKEALPLLRRALQIQDDNNLAEYAQRVERAAKN